MKIITIKEAWRIIRKKKSERDEMEKWQLGDFICHWSAPIRVILFPAAFLIKGIKTAYDWTWDN